MTYSDSSLSEIADNVQFILRELPKLNIAESERTPIMSVCSEFEGAIYDVRKEIGNLAEKLRLRPGEKPSPDADFMNPDPRVTMGFISDWLREPIAAMHGVVTHLQQASESEPKLGIAHLLVAESAVNILNAYGTMQDALGEIEDELNPEPV